MVEYTTPPDDATIQINSGAEKATSREVQVSLSAIDNVGVTGYYLSENSNTPTLDQFVAVPSTSDYSQMVNFSIASAGYGLKTVHAWFRDANGYISDVISDTITLSSETTTGIEALASNYKLYFETENLAALMGLFHDNYLSGGYTKANEESWFESLFESYSQLSASYSLSSVVINDNYADVTVDVFYRGKHNETGEIHNRSSVLKQKLIKVGSVWNIYGDQVRYDISATSHHFMASYGPTGSEWIDDGTRAVEIFIEDPDRRITNITATGPGIATKLTYSDFVYESPYWRLRENITFYDSYNPMPETPFSYLITVTDSMGSFTRQETIESNINDFAEAISPVNEEAISGNPVFRWKKIRSGTEYTYNVELNDSGGQIWQSQTTTEDHITYSGPSLSPGKYHYYVVAKDKYGNAALSLVRNAFVVGQSGVALYLPALSSPAPGKYVSVASGVTINWDDTNDSPGEKGYQVRWKKYDDEAYTYSQSLTPGTTSYTIPASGSGVKYTWSVQALGDGTTVTNSGFASDWFFTTAVKLQTPTLKSPANQASNQPVSVPVTWDDNNSEPQENGYRVVWCTDDDQEQIYESENLPPGTKTYTIPDLTIGKKYWWSVLAVGNGVTTINSDYAAERSFYTIANIPDTTKPTVDAFSIPSTATMLTVWITNFDASDNPGGSGVSEYILTETTATPSPADSRWSVIKPMIHTFSSTGTKTLYAWVKDGAGNVSDSLSDSVTISLPPTADAYTFVANWGPLVSTGVEFNVPMDIEMDGSGNFYVTDRANDRILIFNPQGTYIAPPWGSSGDGDGQFDQPDGIGIDTLGNVYVVDTVNHRVQKLSSTGAYTTEWGSVGSGDNDMMYPEGLAVSKLSGSVYVADWMNNRVLKFNSVGDLQMKWDSSYGSGNLNFKEPMHVALDSGENLYVADRGNNRVIKFDAAGDFVAEWRGVDASPFDEPCGIAVDASDYVYVTDLNNRVQKFSGVGEFITQFGESGTGNGQFSNPMGLVIDDAYNVYVVDTGNNRIQKWSPLLSPNTLPSAPADVNASDGSYLTTIRVSWKDTSDNEAGFKIYRSTTQSGTYTQIGTAVAGATYYDDSRSCGGTKYWYKVAAYNSGGSLGQAGPNDGYTKACETSCSYYISPMSATRNAAAGSGNIAITASAGTCPWTAMSNDEWIAVTSGSSGTGSGTVSYSYGVNNTGAQRVGTITVAGEIFTLTQEFGSSGKYRFVLKWGSEGSGDSQFRYPLGIAVDASGNVYVADSGNHRIQKFTSAGGYITQWGSWGTGNLQFQFPKGIAVDRSGNVYVTSGYTGSIMTLPTARIQKFTSNGGYITQWGSYGSGNVQFRPWSYVATDASGNVYVVDTNNNRIQKFTSTGGYITQWGSYGSGNSQFKQPSGIVVDASGNVYVVDTNNNRIQKFTSTGSYITQRGSEGSGNSQFKQPSGIAVDASGNVYVVDSGNNRIQKFTSTGSYITQWGSEGSGNSQFREPTGIAVDASGNVYVVDSGNNRIQKFAPKSASLPWLQLLLE